MPRYIDADEALRMMRNSKQDCPFVDGKKAVWDVAHNCAISCVDAVPTADVEKVVRCKNCKHSNNSYCAGSFTWCTYFDIPKTEDGYCDHAERKGDIE